MKKNNFECARYKELSERAYLNNRYIFTDFLTLDEQNNLLSTVGRNSSVNFFGGCDNCERVMARFGCAEDLGYEEEFPIVCIKAAPLNIKFSDDLTHRDFLGGLMSLGIERSLIGDIFVDGNSACIFVCERIASYICDNLTKVRHTEISCSVITPEEIPQQKTEEKTINIASLRADCLVSGVFNISRSKCDAYFDAEQVFRNGVVCAKSHTPSQDDVISVRHLGKFKVCETEGTSKKGRLFVKVLKYV